MGDVELPQWLKALPQAPEFHPTEAEFADPIAYILKVEEEAKEFGICKIIPPFTKASKKVVVNNLNRSLSLSIEQVQVAAQGNGGALTRSMGGIHLAKPKGLALDTSTGSDGKAKFATRRQQLGWNPKRNRGVAHSQNHKLVWQSGESYTLEQFEAKAKLFARTRLGTIKDVPPLSVESLFWRAAAEKPISIEYANDIPGSAFSESADSVCSRLRKRKRAFEEVENRCPDNISASCRIEEKVQEEEKPVCSDEFESSDAMKSKNSGLEAGGDNAGAAGSKLANSSWNMRNVARSQGSLLRFMPEEVPGVTSPMVYIGMLFSWFAWHVEDHELHSLNYLHTGASKTWYAVPGDAAPALEEAIRVHGYGGHLNPRAAFSLLGEKTTVMSPEVLVAAGVPCCRLVQNAGEYVVTFPRAYHLGFSHGFNCGEAANFATPGWLEVAKEAAARRAAMNYLPMLSHQQLLYHLTMSLPPRIPTSAPSEPRSSRLKVKKKSLGDEMVKGVFLDDVMHNNRLLHILLDKGVSCCLRAKNIKRVSASLTFFEKLENESSVPTAGAVEGPHQPLVSKARPQGCNGFEVSSPSGQRAGNAEDSGDCHVERQPPAGLHVASVGDSAVESPYIEALASPSARSEVLANGQGGQDVDGTPGDGKNQKTKGALAVDWGTLPCAACGILCFATMAVVEPTSTSAMTFKPIYAAAGLGHCALETKDTGRMDTHIQKQTYEIPTLVVDLSHDVVQDGLNALQKFTCDGKQGVERSAVSNVPSPVESLEAKTKSGLVGAVDAREQSRSLDSQGMLMVAEGPEVATQEECGGLAGRRTCSASDLGATSVNCGIDVINRNVSSLSSSCGHSEEQGDKCSTVRFDGQQDEVETCGDKGNQLVSLSTNHTAAESTGIDGKFSIALVSSLQLLASVYEEGSDLEDEDADESAEDEKQACDLIEGSEVLGKPHNSAGDLLTDEVGLSTDVPWLSLAPLSDPTLLPPPKAISPMFTFSSLTEGPISLEKIFVSSGFAFGDIASADNVCPVLSEEQLEKQSGDVTSKELVLNCPTSCGDGEEDVKDALQELYCRINYQALTNDTEGDDEMLIPFTGRPGISSLTREVVKHECNCGSRERVTAYHSFGSPEMDPTCDPLFDKISCLTSSAPSNKDLVAESESKECGIPSATPEVCEQRCVSKLYEQTSVNSRSTLTYNQEAVACPPTMDQKKESGSIPAPECKRAWSSVARPRVLCLEHAVEAQEQLRSLGGAQIVVVCHSDFENYESRARSLAQEFGSDYKWTHIPFSDEVDDEVRMVNAAVDIEEDDGRRVSDWVMQMGLFIHHRFRERECESSDDSQHGNDDFRAGPFTRVKAGRPGRKKLMASRVGLSRKPDDYPKAYSRNSSQIAPIDSLSQPKISKKKKATVAGRWCGRVWRMNQVHPFLGGNRKVDPSLQLGMSSTSLYALSAMSEFDGNKYRKGTFSSRLESSPSNVLIPIKSAEDEQIAVLQKRGKKQKVIQPGILLPLENGNKTQQDIDTMATAYPQHSLALYTAQVENGRHLPCPVLGTPAEKRNGSEQVGNLSTNDEFYSFRDSQQAENGFAQLARGSDAVQAGTSRTDGKVRQMLALKPLASRDPRAEEAVNNSSNFRTESPAQDVCGLERGASGKHLPSMENFGGKNNHMATRTIEPLPSASVSVQMPTDAIHSADVKAFRFHPSAFPLPANSIHTLSASEKQADGGGSSSSAAMCTTIVRSSVTATDHQGGACQWRDVPVAYPQTFHPAMTHCSRQVINQLVSPIPNINQNQLYIPYSSNPPREAVSDHAFAGQTSDNGKLYSVVSQTFGSLEQGGTKLNSTHLMQSLIATSGTAVENLEQESPSSSGSPLLLSELGNTLKYLPAQHGAGVKRKRERQISGLIGKKVKPVHIEDNAMNFEDLGAPLLLHRAGRSDPVGNEENCREDPIPCFDVAGRVSEEVLCEVDISQPSSHNIKNIIRLPDNNGQSTSDDGPLGLTGTVHLHDSGKVEGQSSPDGADLLRVPGVQQTDCLVYHRKQSIAVTPILSLSPASIESCHPRSMELGYANGTGQGGALVPLTPSVPQPMTRVGRSAVKARGKRAKHVGWTGYRQSQPAVSSETLLNVWTLNSKASGPQVISLQSEECVEARFEVEDCEKAIDLHNHSAAGPLGVTQTLRLRGVPDIEVKKEEVKVRQERAAATSKKKAKLPKKKKVLGRKPAGEDGEFTCDLDGCRMSFPTEAELQMHKRNRCTFKGCEKRFFMHKYLLQHRRVHLDERPLKCPWKGCKQAFKWAWARTEHIRVHTGERPYACPDCDQTFRFVSDFSRHKRNTGHTKS